MGNIDVEYVVTDKGKEMSQESKIRQWVYYLSSGGLFPYSGKLSGKELSVLNKKLNKAINIDEPTIISYSCDISKEVFASIALRIREHERYYDKDVRYTVVDVDKLLSVRLDDEIVDISRPFDNYTILFVKMSISIPHMYNAFCVVEMAKLRKEKGLHTFFFFSGTEAVLKSRVWQLDLNGSGSNVKDDNKILVPITNYISYINLDKYK